MPESCARHDDYRELLGEREMLREVIATLRANYGDHFTDRHTEMVGRVLGLLPPMTNRQIWNALFDERPPQPFPDRTETPTDDHR